MIYFLLFVVKYIKFLLFARTKITILRRKSRKVVFSFRFYSPLLTELIGLIFFLMGFGGRLQGCDLRGYTFVW